MGPLPGEIPESYWSPDLGNAYMGPGLSPSDIGRLTPAQFYMACQFTNTK